MSSFEEFLQNYEAEEREKSEKFIKRSIEGKVPENERYPPEDRFVKLKEPVSSIPINLNIWGVVPFYGSTIIHLIPRDNKILFDKIHEPLGFTSRSIDKLIDLVKETGRIQFSISYPMFYKNLDFLEPLFHELKPPMSILIPESLIEYDLWKKYLVEFDTLAKFGFTSLIYNRSPISGIDERVLIKNRWYNYAFSYIALKTLGYEELAEEIGYLMIVNPREAMKYADLFGNLLAVPKYDSFKPVYNFNVSDLTRAQKLSVDVNKKIPYEIGKFLLDKIVLYPETLEGCMRVIQEYDDYELYNVLGGLDEGVRSKKIDIIEDKKIDMEEILNNIWKDADKIRIGTEGISFGVSLEIALIGELASGFSGMGVLAGLGFQAIDKFWGVKRGSISEKIAKVVYPNYLVAIYDFKKKHALND